MFHQTAVEKILEDKGAKESMDINIPLTTTDYVLTESTLPEKISRDYYYLTAQLTLEMHNTILVVAATYQGVLQPPGGVYPAPDPETLVSHLHPRLLQLGDDTWKKHVVMEKAKYRYFMPSNTFAFVLSVVIVIFMVPGNAVFLILHVCLVFMCISYLLALDAIS